MSDTFFVGYAYDEVIGADRNNPIIISIDDVRYVEAVRVTSSSSDTQANYIGFGVGIKNSEYPIQVYFENLETAIKEHNNLVAAVLNIECITDGLQAAIEKMRTK